MRNEQLESWVLNVCDLVARRVRVEDSRVELKSKWPDPETAARKIAAHANSAGGESILWIIGLDERTGLTPCSGVDLATWQSQIESQFDGIAPAVQELLVPVANGSVMALLFDTSRRPYVVRNPKYGQPDGGAVSLEVPWRSGTGVRTARREELLRLLAPLEATPIVEILSAEASVASHEAMDPSRGDMVDQPVFHEAHLSWHFQLELYVTPKSSEMLVLPVHRTAFAVRFANGDLVAKPRIQFYVPVTHGVNWSSRSDSVTVARTNAEAILTGPGLIRVETGHVEPLRLLPSGQALEFSLSICPAGQERQSFHEVKVELHSEDGEYRRSWRGISEAPKSSSSTY